MFSGNLEAASECIDNAESLLEQEKTMAEEEEEVTGDDDDVSQLTEVRKLKEEISSRINGQQT